MDRLQKVLAQAGVVSRRKSEELILSGAVRVNDEIITELGYKVTSKDKIYVNGILIKKEEHVYFALNKPTGCVSTVSDELNRKTVLDLFSEEDKKYRIYPVGRLDYDTAGLLFLTNDGEFAEKLTSPKSEIEKEYMARVEGMVTKLEALNLSRGVVLKTGYKTKPAYVKVVSSDKRNNSSLLKIVIKEGKNHQVRLMCEAINHKVKKLTRVRIGTVTVNEIPRGGYRKLKIHEIKQLMNL